MKNFKNVVKQIAEENNTTEAEVLSGMQRVIDNAYFNQDPQVKAVWDSIPCKGTRPTAEETIEYIVIELLKKQKLMN